MGCSFFPEVRCEYSCEWWTCL